jgi:hypothetical protein
MTPLQDLDYGVACVGVKNNPLPAVHANDGGNQRDPCLRQHFESYLNVSGSEVRFFFSTLLAEGIEQAAPSEDLGAKLTAIRTGFVELLQQNGNSHIAITR